MQDLAAALRPNLRVRGDKAFHLSAVHAAAIDVATSAYRLAPVGMLRAPDGTPLAAAPPAEGDQK